MDTNHKITSIAVEKTPGDFSEERKTEGLKDMIAGLAEIDLSKVSGILFVAVPKDIENDDIDLRWAGTRDDRHACLTAAIRSNAHIGKLEDSEEGL